MKYLNVWDYFTDSDINFFAMYTGRGTGKTYSALERMAREKIKHIYLRRTQTEIDMTCNRDVHPYKSINVQNGYSITVAVHNKMSIIYDESTEENLGYGLALSTFSNVKGADFSEIEYIIFDEFNPPPNKPILKDEAGLFFELYETVARNREIAGKDPVKVLLLSNAVSVYTPIMAALGMSTVIEMMNRKHQQKYTDRQRGIQIHVLQGHEVSDAKKETALYRLTSGTDFYNYSINNEFTGDSMYNVQKKNVIEYTPYCAYEEIYIYRHKNTNEYYCCYTHGDCPAYNRDTYSLFRRNHWIPLREAMIAGYCFFETFVLKKKVYELLKI